MYLPLKIYSSNTATKIYKVGTIGTHTMSESEGMNLPLILTGVAAVLILLALFLPVQTANPDFCTSDCGITVGDWSSDGDNGTPQTFVILGLIAMIGAVVMLQVPALADFSKFAGVVALLAGVFGFIAWFSLLGEYNDAEIYGIQFIEWSFGGWSLLLGSILGLVGGGLHAKDNMM